MRRFHIAVLTAMAAIGFASIAFTADASDNKPAFNWTGFYFGGHIGGARNANDNSFANMFTYPGSPPATIPNLPFDTGGNGINGGVQAGYNLQLNRNWLIGVEGDFSGTNLDGHQTYNPIPPGPSGYATPPCYITMSRDLSWLTSIRGRFGFAWDRLLFFATGGAAWINTDYFGIESRVRGDMTDVADLKLAKTGWAAGGGVEYAVASNWTIRGEYLSYNTNGVHARSNQVPPIPFPVFTVFDWDKTNIHVLRFALNFKFH